MKKMKVCSALLSAVMLCSFVTGITGCSSSDNDGNGGKSGFSFGGKKTVVKNTVEEVAADSLWFNYKRSDIDLFEEDYYLDSYIDTNFVKVNGGYATYATSAPYEYEQIHNRYVLIFDENGNQTDKIEITEESLGMPKSEYSTYAEILGITSENGDPVVLVNISYYEEDTLEFIEKHVKYNARTGEVVDTDFLYTHGFMSDVGSLSNGYLYAVCCQYSSEGENITVNFGKDGKLIESVDISKELGGLKLEDCVVDSDTDNVVKLNVYGTDKNYLLSINTEDWSIKKSETTYSISDENDYYQKYIADDGKEYVVKEDGIYCSDLGEIVLPFDSSYANIHELANSSIIDVDDAHFVLVSSDYSDYAVKASMHIFDKADSNPNAGKDIITVGYIGELEPNTASVISEFNQASDSYYVKAVSYVSNMFGDDTSGMNVDEYNNLAMKKDGALANELIMDLLAGDGPDIIMNAASYTQLNSDNYLVDLSSFESDELKDIDLFDNVIEASKTGDKLYQIPLTFSVEGIFADDSIVSDKNGFTFPEYCDYVNQECNGKSPIAIYSSRLEVLADIMSSMSDEFFDEDGNVDFNNETFFEVAKYCKDNVPEFSFRTKDGGYDFSSQGFGYGLTGNDNTVINLTNIEAYMTTMSFNPKLKLYGIPSIDGRGPSIHVTSSVAISSAVADIDGAKAFVKFLVENEDNSSWTNSISTEVTKNLCTKIVDRHNREYDKDLLWSTEEMMRLQYEFRFDYDIVDDYIDILNSASTIKAFDPDILVIVTEEIPGYFLDQKSIEDVSEIIENRSQTVIDERNT